MLLVKSSHMQCLQIFCLGYQFILVTIVGLIRRSYAKKFSHVQFLQIFCLESQFILVIFVGLIGPSLFKIMLSTSLLE